MIKRLIFSSFILLFSFQLFSQPAGMRAHVGIASLVNQNDSFAPNDAVHTGFTAGIDGRLFSGTAAFVVGGRYTSVTKIPSNEFLINGDVDKLNIFNGRVGLETVFVKFAEIIRIRGKLLGSVDINLSTTGDNPPINGGSFNDGWAGIVGGLGVDIGPAVIDFEYEYGILNAYSEIKDATFNSWTLTTGVFF